MNWKDFVDSVFILLIHDMTNGLHALFPINFICLFLISTHDNIDVLIMFVVDAVIVAYYLG